MAGPQQRRNELTVYQDYSEFIDDRSACVPLAWLGTHMKNTVLLGCFAAVR